MMLPELKGKRILLGVTGSIAAYKSVVLLRWLMKAGAEVKVVLTPSVSRFVAPLSFNSLTGDTAFSDLWGEDWSRHVELGLWADLLLVAPASANTLAKMAHGQCDNALMAVFLAAKCPVMVAPAMDRDMYLHPATQHNLALLAARGTHVLPTGEGYLASGLEGPGRMLEHETIGEKVADFFSTQTHPYWKGKRLLITAGPTVEAIDPVRFISNHSSGKMGYALAAAALRQGAVVTLVHGPTHLPAVPGATMVPVHSAEEMMEAVVALQQAQDVFIFSAAVADYRPAEVAEEKIKKKTDELTIRLVKNPDILHHVGHSRLPHQRVVGFALETEAAMEHGREKLVRKKAHAMVINSLREPGAGFMHDTNRVTLIGAGGEEKAFPLMSKTALAAEIIGWLPEILAVSETSLA